MPVDCLHLESLHLAVVRRADRVCVVAEGELDAGSAVDLVAAVDRALDDDPFRTIVESGRLQRHIGREAL